jgi:hypothetical protein
MPVYHWWYARHILINHILDRILVIYNLISVQGNKIALAYMFSVLCTIYLIYSTTHYMCLF